MLVPSDRRPRAGHCFRTAADGRIPLIHDWLRLLREARRVERFALQTRHACARLVTYGALPDISIRPGKARAIAANEKAILDFRFASWAQAWGYLRTCDCCDSPGRLEILNHRGGEFLQLCAMPGDSPHDWSDYLAAVATGGPAHVESKLSSDEPLFVLPRVQGAHASLPFHLDDLRALLAAFGDEGLPLRGTLRTADLSHQREFVPREMSEHGGILTLGEEGTRLQLAWPTLVSFAVTHDTRGWALHLLNRDATIVLTLSAAFEPVAAATWHNALQTAFPGLG